MKQSRQVRRRQERLDAKEETVRAKNSAEAQKRIPALDKEGADWVEANKDKFFRLQGEWFKSHDYYRVPVKLIKALPGRSTFNAVVLVETEDGTQLEVFYKELDVSDTPLKSLDDECDDIMARIREKAKSGQKTDDGEDRGFMVAGR